MASSIEYANLVFLVVVLNCIYLSAGTDNHRPIVGIVAQETGPDWKQYGDSYIESPYVGYLEQAGARVVPVRINESVEYYTTLFSKINGVLFPGGGASLFRSGYARAARLMYRLAIEANNKGDHFPLWGTCLGFEELLEVTAGTNVLSLCKGENIRLPLHLTPESKDSRLMRKMPERLLDLLTQTNITYNAHHYCVKTQTFRDNGALREFYRVISINKDLDGLEFVSTMEAYEYPFYGIQWHAEKNNWFWDERDDVEHSLGSALVSQYMADYFVQSARESSHRFSSPEEEAHYMIERVTPVYLGQPEFYSLYAFHSNHLDDSNSLASQYDKYETEDHPHTSVVSSFRMELGLVLLGCAVLVVGVMAIMVQRWYKLKSRRAGYMLMPTHTGPLQDKMDLATVMHA